MGLLERAIRKGVSEAVGKAVGSAITKAVEPKATELANRAAAQLDQTAENAVQQTQAATNSVNQSTSGFEGAFSNLQRSMESYATAAAKNTKVCPNCNEVATADKKFCPKCGTKLPEQTLAQGAVCTQCGKQNTIGTKFCQECGAKLPSAIAEEQARADKNSATLAKWDTALVGFPKWDLGGNDFYFDIGDGYVMFSANYSTPFEAQNAVEQYRAILKQNGFKEEGEYPEIQHLYKKVNGISYHVDTEHCFEGDSETADIYFMHDEPIGGFDYVKPEPKKTSLFDFFK